MKPRNLLAVVLAAVVAGAAIIGGVVWAVDDGGGSSKSNVAAVAQPTTAPTSSSSNSSNTSTSGAATQPTDFSSLYDAVRPSVVRITTGQSTGDPFSGQAEGLGSGIILDTEGRILTNYHVVTGFSTVTVTFSDGSAVQAKVVGKDPGNDVAMVKTDAGLSELAPAKLGDSDAVKVGSVVAAIGNPFGLDGTFTTGVISGLHRTLPSNSNGRPIRGLLQTDTAVNPGNSGGALFNLQGEVIGINTAIENPTGNGFVGIAYAVPINTPKRFLSQLVSGETITHPRLGFSGRTLSPEDAQSIGVPQGVAVVAVESGSAGDAAGLRGAANGSGDVIVEIDGQPTKSFEDLADYIDSKQVGDQVTLKVHRGGKDIELHATLKSWESAA